MSVRLLAAGLPPAALARVAPVADGAVEPLPEWEPAGPGCLRLALALDAASLAGAERVVPSLSSVAAGDHASRFALRTRWADGTWSSRVPLARIGRMPPGAVSGDDPEEAGGPRLGADVDTFLLRAPAVAAELEVRVWSADPDAFRRAPCLVAVSCAGPPAAEPPADAPADVPALAVPALSQMAEDERIRARICSPTSVAMVLRHLGAPAPVAAVAEAAFCADLDRYGVWPAAVWAASRWGALGCVVALRSWDSARALLANGVPLVISEAHALGALPGSPLPETDGHLLVLRGFEGGMALVNDPAAADVARAYPARDLGHAWLGHGGIAYLFVSPDFSEGRP